ncbi:MAG: universal stress protein [Xanthomonadales bacterium]|nr:universal stress protein [Xanthomonadales bacterium]
MSQPIIVGYDGSGPSKKALDHAITLASRFGASIHLVHVIDWSPYEFHTLEENETVTRQRREELERDRRELFPPAEQKIAEAGIDAAAELRYGHPAEVLAQIAEETAAFCLVVGRTGTSRIKSLLLGNIASNSVLLANCPVVVVP